MPKKVKPAARGEDTPFFYFLCAYAFTDSGVSLLSSLDTFTYFSPYVGYSFSHAPLSGTLFTYLLAAFLGLYGLIKGPSLGRIILLSAGLTFHLLNFQPGLAQPPFLALFLVLPILGSALYLFFWEGEVTREKMYALYAPAGRWLLIIMYFWGTFHKINTDFFNPDSSCATLLMRSLDYIVPFGLAEVFWVHVLAIYGTLILETAVMVMLLIPSQRYNARILGLCFHILIGFSYFRDYRAFSLLAIALHTLFLPAGSAENVLKTWDKAMRWLKERTALRWVGDKTVFWSLISLCGSFLIVGIVFTYSALFWGILCFFILLWMLCTRASPTVYRRQTFKKYFRPAVPSLLLIPFAYFVLCGMPYVGLKTAQALNMFSNLHTEGGYSNHYFFPKPLYLFDYQKDIVKITRMDDREMPDGPLEPTVGRHMGRVYYDFIYMLKKAPDMYVEYQVNDGKTRIYKGDGDIPDLDILLPYPLEKFFVFNPVFLGTPPLPAACF